METETTTRAEHDWAAHQQAELAGTVLTEDECTRCEPDGVGAAGSEAVGRFEDLYRG